MADAAGKTQLDPNKSPPRTRKLFSSFIFKPVMAVLFLVLVPVLTSHPPEFIFGQSAPFRSWEILHILLVGIAVSYGLFSKRNAAAEDEDKEREKNGHEGKFENTQSYVSRFLQLSSLFDDESDGGGGGSSSSPCGSDVGRIQSMSWNNQYFRNEPMLIIDEDRNVGDSSAAWIRDKPLLLPVRSLRARVPDDPRDDSVVSGVSPASLSRSGSTRSMSRDADESGGSAASLSRSSSNPGSISRRFPNGGLNTWDDPGESGVSAGSFGRPGENSKRVPNGGLALSRNGWVSDAGYLESEANVKDSVVLPSPIPWLSRSGRMMESREGVDSVDTFQIDDLGESRPQASLSSSMALSTPSPNRLSPSSSLSSVSPEAKFVPDSLKKKSSSHKVCIPVPPPPPPLPPAETFRFLVEKTQSVLPPVNNGNNLLSVYRDMNGNRPKSVRTIRAPDIMVRKNVLKENFFDGVLENEEDQMQEFFKRMIIESEDEETENDNDDDSGDNVVADEEDTGVLKDGGTLPSNEVVEVVSHGVNDGGPDVDKKADEFIAKFRKQIRLQRIESIKRSSTEISKNFA